MLILIQHIYSLIKSYGLLNLYLYIIKEYFVCERLFICLYFSFLAYAIFFQINHGGPPVIYPEEI